ncbi:hypothetical protein [Haloarchaeobius sp. TZWSO28]|uniref:hypothetical protein n=1 Tax=Haloarchaeobius sp. TZWSO28 TaxID=3446119 RepID=UPI003EB8DC0F
MSERVGEHQQQPPRGSLEVVIDAVVTLSRDPALFVPYLLAGLVVAVIDAVQIDGPLPVDVQTVATSGLVHVRIRPFPGVVRVVHPWLGGVLGLEPWALLTTIAATGVVVAGSVLAMAVVVVRADRAASLTRQTGGRLLLYALAVGGAMAAVESLAHWYGFPATMLAVLGTLLLAMRTFPVPVLVLRGRSLPDALARGVRLTGGHTLCTFGLVVGLGLGAHLLASPVPLLDIDLPLAVGTLLATTVVGPVHALATLHATETFET